MTADDDTPLGPVPRFRCPMCDAVHVPARCQTYARFGVCGCCWAIDWMMVEPLP